MVLVKSIWLIGGTQESAQLASRLVGLGIKGVVTVTTPSARRLYPPGHECLKVWVGKLTSETIQLFLAQYNVSAILDASHPFAVAISELAIATAQQYSLPYLRYERPPVSPPSLTDEPRLEQSAQDGNGSPIWVESYTDLLDRNLLFQQRVLLTIGYRSLPLFQPWHTQATLFARILPSATALQTALAAGFLPQRLIAIRPPLTFELELALWRQWRINLVVAKASGEAGGERLKRQLARQLQIPLILVRRPVLTVPADTQSLEVAIEFCLRHSPHDGVQPYEPSDEN